MLGGVKSGHNCQIDCTNHDEVINKLQIKSKDLYYFWRNYEWLYNKYYTQKNEEPSINHQKYQELQDQIQRLETDNKKLRIQNQSLKKKLYSDSMNNNIKTDYQRQISRLQKKCVDYQGIRDKQNHQINTLKNQIRQLSQTTDDNQARLKKQIRKQQSIIVDLQQNIDELRSKMMNQNTGNNQVQSIQERYHRQMQKLKVMVSSLQNQCYEIVDEQFENSRYQLLQQFPRVFQQFSQGDLSNIVMVEEIQEQ